MKDFVNERSLFMQHFAGKTVGQLNADSIDGYETLRFKQGVSARTVATERGILIRALGSYGKRLRLDLTTIKVEPSFIGKAYTADEQRRMLEATMRMTPGRTEKESPCIEFALRMQLNGGFRDAEIRTLRWKQVDLLKHIVQIGKAKTKAGSGRRVPMNAKIRMAFEAHAAWYTRRFGKPDPGWYVFPWGRVDLSRWTRRGPSPHSRRRGTPSSGMLASKGVGTIVATLSSPNVSNRECRLRR